MSDRAPAPHALDLVIGFVNTVDLERGEEQLTDTAALASWLSEHGLLDGGPALSRADLNAALELREALRASMLSNNGAPQEPAAGERLEQAASRGRLSVRFEAGGARIAPREEGLPGALAALLVPVAESMADGTWQRVKACRADDCHWAFYDHSRNRSGTWCEMAVCGNREKVRAYRGRAAG